MLNEAEKMANRQPDQLMTNMLKIFSTNLRHRIDKDMDFAKMLRVDVKEKQKNIL
jgi:hypothetical protein